MKYLISYKIGENYCSCTNDEWSYRSHEEHHNWLLLNKKEDAENIVAQINDLLPIIKKLNPQAKQYIENMQYIHFQWTIQERNNEAYFWWKHNLNFNLSPRQLAFLMFLETIYPRFDGGRFVDDEPHDFEIETFGDTGFIIK